MRAGLVSLLLVLLPAGCMNRLEQRCASCAVLDAAHAEGGGTLRATDGELVDARRVQVVLVPGAFGFGDEWDPVLVDLRARGATFAVFQWAGPWGGMGGAAHDLTRALQSLLDRPGAPTLLVIAHSAGGAIARAAAHDLRVPEGRAVTVGSVAMPAYLDVVPWRPEREVNTPLGVSIGGDRIRAPLPSRVSIVEYLNEDRPESAPQRESDVARVLTGSNAGHNRVLGLAARDLLEGGLGRQFARR